MKSSSRKAVEEIIQDKEIKEAVKKPESKRQYTKKALKTKIVVQYLGNEITPDNLIERVKQEFIAEGGEESEIKNLELYIKPEDNTAYYVINGKVIGNVAMFA